MDGGAPGQGQVPAQGQALGYGAAGPAHAGWSPGADAAVAGPRLVASSGTSLQPPPGWVLVDDVTGTGARAPAVALADASGRHVAAQLDLRRLRSGGPGTVIGWGASSAPTSGSADELLEQAARSRVAAALAEDPYSVLLDARTVSVRTDRGRQVTAVRLDVVEHDMTTPVVRTSILVPGAGAGAGAGAGWVDEVSATVPVAHHRALVQALEEALASVTLADAAAPHGAAAASPEVSATSSVHPAQHAWLVTLDQDRWYVPPEAWLGAEELDVFVRGSHRLAPAHRPGPVRAGLLTPDGRATTTGELVRRAVHRPDVRVHVRAAHPADGLASMVVDRVGTWAVIRSTPPPGALAPGQPPAAHRYVEVVDLAAAPARVVAWTSTGPGRAFRTVDGTVLSLGASRPGEGWGSRHVGPAVPLEPWLGPRDVWHGVLAALG